ncbi:schwannomin-interacting protein 1 [Plakobranchus ocellatus]|uniref:Schwannomin-interacting protein 1 n=1 Tax=Plakobranchus ocellatus TaxID=259542 RepID=A0AAV3XV41_9GAST|nr:schwannomin-interacting protein 1 [Plakobranchus ocellatus]
MATSPKNNKPEEHLVLDLSHVELDAPDYESIRQQRMDRNRRTMEVDQNGAETNAAVQIQRFYRGHQGRKEYTNRLFAKYEQEEKLRWEKMEQQVHEGQLLVNK